MEYVHPFGVNTPNAPYVDRNTPGATNGSKVGAKAIEHPMREIVAAIEASGQIPNAGNLTQLSQAIALSGSHHDFALFGNPGPANFVAPLSCWYLVHVYGGGGGAALYSAANSAEGGGGGGYARKWVKFAQGDVVPLTIGTGGLTYGTLSQNGIAGGSTSFGAYCSATGGDGATVAGQPGSGGFGVGGDFNLEGQAGMDGVPDYAQAGLGGDAAGPQGGKGARSSGSGTWPGGGGSCIASGSSYNWIAFGAGGGIIIEY